MRIFTTLLTLLAIASAPFIAGAQELNCQVEVNSDQIQGSNKSLFETLKASISDYMNTTQFTQAQFGANEKIDCRLFFTFKKLEDSGKLSGDLQVQASRPVYNSTYTTNLLNFKDTKIEFEYTENEPLVFSETEMVSNLTQILNYYAYLILALDFDSFSPRGGEPYWEKLKTLVQQAQSSGETGWKAFEETKNRSAVVSAYTDVSTQGIRDLYYKYHRQGLDEMSVSPDKGRQAITESLNEIKKIYDASSMSVALSMFKDAKLDELVNVYSKAPSDERTKVYELLYPIYPAENSRLEEIKKGKEK